MLLKNVQINQLEKIIIYLYGKKTKTGKIIKLRLITLGNGPISGLHDSKQKQQQEYLIH